MTTFHRRVAIASLIAMFGVAACRARPHPGPRVPATCAAAGTSAVLYVTEAAGFAHPVLGHSVDVLAQLGSDSAAFHLAWQANAAAAINARELTNCAAVVFFTTGELPLSAEQKSALLTFVSSGGGFVGIHSATDTLYGWPEYGQLVGARFDGHPWTGPATVSILDPKHPSMRGLPSPWVLSDEIYQFKEFVEAGTAVLIALDTSSVDVNGPRVHHHPWGFPLAWTRTYGKGRVFYSALGHGDIWDDERFRRFVLGGIESVLSDGSRPR